MSVPTELWPESEKYRVIRELGRGGMGVVYLAEDQQLKREVALKVLYDHLNREHAFVERFQEEARSVSTLHHPNIVCVHGLVRSGETAAIDMEYVDGLSLSEFHRAAHVTPHVVVGIARDVLGGLAVCHHMGVVHRDIKPSNILLSEEGAAKITDFGLATAYATHLEATIQGNTSTGFYMGTPRYMPVQAWEGERPAPFWDLYSFGVVLFELLSGRVAFEGDNPMAIMRKHITEPLPRLRDVTDRVSPALSAFVESLLASEGGETEATGADALETLRETPEYHALQESTAAATLALPPRRKRRRLLAKPARIPWRRLGTGLAIAAVAMVLGAWAMHILTGDGGNGGSINTHRTSDGTKSARTAPAPPPRANGANLFLDVKAVNGPGFERGTWMVERNGRGMPKHIVGIAPLELWSMDVDPPEAGGRQNIHGSWAACLLADNRTAQYGSLTGSLLWESAAGRLTVHAERVRTRDNGRDDMSLVGQLTTETVDRTAFVRDLESSDVLQSLLYRELLERRLPWAEQIEDMLPALPDGRVYVPSAGNAVAIDGVLGDAMWTTEHFDRNGRAGELPAQSPADNPVLYLRWNAEGLYLAAQIPSAEKAPLLELGVLPAFETSLADSGRFFVTFNQQGRARARYLVRGREVPWRCDWEGTVHVGKNNTAVEVHIPLDALKDVARPRPGKRWRLNARISAQQSSGGARETVARWGDQDLEALEHGALLVFRAPNEARSAPAQ